MGSECWPKWRDVSDSRSNLRTKNGSNEAGWEVWIHDYKFVERTREQACPILHYNPSSRLAKSSSLVRLPGGRTCISAHWFSCRRSVQSKFSYIRALQKWRSLLLYALYPKKKQVGDLGRLVKTLRLKCRRTEATVIQVVNLVEYQSRILIFSLLTPYLYFYPPFSLDVLDVTYNQESGIWRVLRTSIPIWTHAGL